MGPLYYQFGFILIIATCLSESAKPYFTAAVFEHARQEDGSPIGVKTNLKFYRRAAEEASKQGAELIVFPEYGIFPPGNRNVVKKYLEQIPNPKETLVVPCNEIYRQKSPILYSLSCMAKNNHIIVVANVGGIEKCHGKSIDEDGECPTDGNLHLNANVAFDQNGTLIGRFYKEHLYFELGMDLPREKQDPTFETNIGKFAMFICFETIFKKMAETSRLIDVEAVLFSTMWMNSSPFFTGTQWFQAFSIGNNATLLAANINMPGYLSTGSGIYRGSEGAIVSTFNPDGISKLVIATIPKRNSSAISSRSKIFSFTENNTKPYRVDFEDLPLICSYRVLGKPKTIANDYRCITENLDNYTLIKLDKTEDHLEVCNNGMCCELDYAAKDMNENFFFGVYNGTHIPYFRYPWSEENCFLARCQGFNGSVCANIPMKSETIFYNITMRANFTTKYVYPSLISSNMRLVPAKQWTYGVKDNKHTIEFSRYSGNKVIVAALKGRAYHRDPPYVR